MWHWMTTWYNLRYLGLHNLALFAFFDVGKTETSRRRRVESWTHRRTHHWLLRCHQLHELVSCGHGLGVCMRRWDHMRRRVHMVHRNSWSANAKYSLQTCRVVDGYRYWITGNRHSAYLRRSRIDTMDRFQLG